MTNEYHHSIEEWLEICDKHYHNKTPTKNDEPIAPKKKNTKKDNPHINPPIMKLF